MVLGTKYYLVNVSYNYLSVWRCSYLLGKKINSVLQREARECRSISLIRKDLKKDMWLLWQKAKAVLVIRVSALCIFPHLTLYKVEFIILAI